MYVYERMSNGEEWEMGREIIYMFSTVGLRMKAYYSKHVSV
jgi:hypothetical protein